MRKLIIGLYSWSFAVSLAIATPQAPSEAVRSAEAEFAGSMAARDFSKFAALVSHEAIFFAGSKVLRGNEEILGAWKKYYDGPSAPFSWKPEVIEVLDSGIWL